MRHPPSRCTVQLSGEFLTSSQKAVRALSLLAVLALGALSAIQAAAFFKLLPGLTPRHRVLAGLGLTSFAALMSYAAAGEYGQKVYDGAPSKYVGFLRATTQPRASHVRGSGALPG